MRKPLVGYVLSLNKYLYTIFNDIKSEITFLKKEINLMMVLNYRNVVE